MAAVEYTVLQKCAAEFWGTFGVVFCGTGAIIINDLYGGVISHTGVAITFGVIVMTMIYSLQKISGAHMNPAVTIALWVNGNISRHSVLPYAIAQIAGALMASAILRFLFPGSESLGATFPSGSILQSFVMELILTFMLMWVILRIIDQDELHSLAGGIIGGVVLLEAMFAGPVSGASMNPARSIAPGCISGHIEHLWIYVVATTLGAVLAVRVNNFWQIKRDSRV
jgi:aquaporin Z